MIGAPPAQAGIDLAGQAIVVAAFARPQRQRADGRIVGKDAAAVGAGLDQRDINPMLPDSRTDQGQAEQLGVKFFPAMMLVNPKSGQVKPLSYGFISQDDLAKQFLYVSSDFKPNF